MTERPGRFAEVDVVKAVGVLTVVLIHAVRSPFEPGAAAFEPWIGQMTRFAVPGFLVVSGFLYATRQRVDWPTTRSRLVRIAVPYLVFSGIAQILRHTQGPELWGPGSGQLWLDLAFGASLGPYYYVFIAALLVSTALLYARLGPREHLGVFAFELVAQGTFETASRLPFILASAKSAAVARLVPSGLAGAPVPPCPAGADEPTPGRAGGGTGCALLGGRSRTWVGA